MKRIITICLLAVSLLAGVMSLDAKTTKKKSKTRTNQTSNTSRSSNNLNGHAAVDLGLSVKWATCNLGASVEYERGDFFLWQEYYDPVRQRWGGSWRTPTLSEFQELYQRCRWEWKRCTYSDDNYRYCSYGYLVTGPNGNSIFLPANGRKYQREDTRSITLYDDGFYWTRTYAMERGKIKPYVCSFDFGSIYFPYYDTIYAMGIRPVTK